MIVSLLINLVWLVVQGIISLLGVIPGFPAEVISSALTYIDTVLTSGSGLFFFIIRPQTFANAMDILFFIWAAEPLYHFIMWVIRKIPVVNIE